MLISLPIFSLYRGQLDDCNGKENFEKGRRYLFFIFWIFLPLPAETGEPLAVIVHPSNTLENLPFEDLVSIFKLERQYWPQDGRIYLLLHEAASAEQKKILDQIYGMDAPVLKRMWLAKIYGGEISAFPKTCSSSESIKAFVKAVPTAIGIVRFGYVDADVKVLKIDGRSPTEEGYRLIF